jgi:hypothetical protein
LGTKKKEPSMKLHRRPESRLRRIAAPGTDVTSGEVRIARSVMAVRQALVKSTAKVLLWERSAVVGPQESWMAMSQPMEKRVWTKVEARSLFGTRVLKWAMSLSAMATASPVTWRSWSGDGEEGGAKAVMPWAKKPKTNKRLHHRKPKVGGRAWCAPAV